MDPRISLSLLQAELQLANLRYQPNIAEQNAMNYERVRAELLRVRAELAIAKVNRERAANEVKRNFPLYQEKLVSEDIYDLSLKTRDAFQAEIDEKTKAVTELEGRLQQLRSLGDPQAAPTNQPLVELLARLDADQASAASNTGPITLLSPIDGMVSIIFRQSGEYVIDGEPLVTIHSPWAERVVGYLHQPYPIEPRVGLRVMITTRETRPKRFWSEITQVGAQVEVITNALAFIRQGSLVDVGLPVVVDLPPGTPIRPGELVDMMIKPGTGRANPQRPNPIQPDTRSPKSAIRQTSEARDPNPQTKEQMAGAPAGPTAANGSVTVSPDSGAQAERHQRPGG
jgi:biotin carboxyl carrier protein